MIWVLQQILCAIKILAMTIVSLLVGVLNLLIAAVGAFANLVVWLLPGFPEPPQWDSRIVEGINYFYPVGTVVSGMLVFVMLYGVFLLWRVALNWAKAM